MKTENHNLFSPVIFRHFINSVDKIYYQAKVSYFFESFRKANTPAASRALDNINPAPGCYTRPPMHKG